MRAYPHNRRWLQASLSNDQEAAIACELSTFRHHLTACHLLQVAREASSLVASADEESVVKLVDKHHFGGSSAFAGIQPPNTGSHATVLAAVMSRRRCVLCALRFISFVAGGTTVGAEAYGRRQRQRIRSITSGTLQQRQTARSLHRVLLGYGPRCLPVPRRLTRSKSQNRSSNRSGYHDTRGNLRN